MPELAIVIVSYNTIDILRECLQAALRHSRTLRTEIIVVDNASRDGSAEMVRREFPTVRVLALDHNLGFGGGNNLGVEATRATYLLLLNSDAILHSDAGAALVDYLRNHEDVVCAGPKVVLRDGRAQPGAFGEQPSLWRIAMQSSGINRLAPRSRWLSGIEVDHGRGPVMTVGWISGVCMAMRRADYVAAGGFDRDLFMYCEDIDLCARLQRDGRRVVRLDAPEITHYHGASARTMPSRLRSAVWQQRNLLRLVHRQSGTGARVAAQLMLLTGQMPRIAAGLAMSPRRGWRDNLLLRSALIRSRDLLGLLHELPQG